MTATGTASRALRVNPAALAQRIDQQLRSHRAEPHPVVLVRAEPVWPHEPTLTTAGGRQLRIVPCVSMLAVWEQLAQPRNDTTLVLLTDLTERELGPGILSEVFRQRIITVEPWDLVAETFGAQRLDPRLQAEAWAGEALLDAMPPEGWPRLAGTVLSHDHALRHLAAARLRLDRLGLGPDDLDARALLQWSNLPGAAKLLSELREPEREGLAGWLTDACGQPARAVLALLEAGHLDDALPLGLVCAAIWSANDPEALRAQGRIEQYFGTMRLESGMIRAYAEVATDIVADLLRNDTTSTDYRTGSAVLDRAEELLLQFAAADVARDSLLLRTGFHHRADVVATALQDTLAQPTPERIGATEAALNELARHHLAQRQPHRVERPRMALRLIRWLATPHTAPESVADGVERHVREWGWVDLALAHVWAGEDTHTGLKRALGAVYEQAVSRRRHLDQAFAEHLATWFAADTPPGKLLTIERVLDEVVAPLVRRRDPVLLVVLDGMSAAVAADLADDLKRQHWVEYDPITDTDGAHRRAALAVVPSITAVSRTSLFAGALRHGNAADERGAFESHPRWRGRPARLFHKSLIAGGAGEVLDQELENTLSAQDTLVAVVINTIDDALGPGREGLEPGWRVAQVGPLQTLLDYARAHGRSVVITSDHGHVLDQGSTMRTVESPNSARHRTDAAPAADGEVTLAGPRVVAEQQRVVALWDPALRYLPRRAGYHGGASLAEMTVPVLAFRHSDTEAPRRWTRLSDPHPTWWNTSHDLRGPFGSTATETPAVPRPRSARTSVPAGDPLFEVASTSPPSLVEALLDSEMFKAQHALTPRKMPLPKIRGALTALVDANGTLPSVLVAERAGERPERANGFITTLQRIFNVDNYPVLSLTDEGRTVRLDLPLLREQFGIHGVAR